MGSPEVSALVSWAKANIPDEKDLEFTFFPAGGPVPAGFIHLAPGEPDPHAFELVVLEVNRIRAKSGLEPVSFHGRN